MRKKQIEIDAELVMRYLETSGSKSCSFKELEHALNLSSRSLDQALGCLSHEGRIRMDEQAEQISLAVCPFF